MGIVRKRSLTVAPPPPAMKASSLSSTTSAAPSHKHFLGGIWLRLRSISPPSSQAEQVVSVYIHTHDLDEVNRPGRSSGN